MEKNIKDLLSNLMGSSESLGSGSEHAKTIIKMLRSHGQLYGLPSLGALMTTLVMAGASELMKGNGNE